MAAKDVVLVDDDDTSNLIHARLIRIARPDMTVRAFLKAEEALGAIHADPPALILLDLNMPGMNGWGFLEAMQADTLVIMVSSSIDPADREKAFRYPVVRGFISKPVSADAVRDTFSQLGI